MSRDKKISKRDSSYQCSAPLNKECKEQDLCKGCGFKYFDELYSHQDDKGKNYLKDLRIDYLKLAKSRTNSGRRITLDKPLEEFVLKELKRLGLEPTAINRNELSAKLGVESVRIKCDIALHIKEIPILIEVKMSGNDTNGILSAIASALFARETEKFKKCKYYFVGGSRASNKERGGITRDFYINRSKKAIKPYVLWAEEKNLIKFYGVVEIPKLIEDIVSRTRAESSEGYKA